MRLIRLLKRDLARECAEWLEDNVINEEQAVQICERYGMDFHKASEQSYGYAVLIGLGYLFIGLAVITLLSANWEEIPRAVRMGGLLLLTLGTHALAIKNYQKGEESVAIGLFFLGSLFYGASIMLIAQIYHIDEHFPNGILWWSIGVLPLALLLGSSLLMALSMALAFTWFFVEAGLNYYPVLFPVFLAALGWHVFRVKESYVLFLAFIAGVGIWLEYSLGWYLGGGFHFEFEMEHFVVAVGYFLILQGLAKWLVSREESFLKDYGIILGLWVLRFAIIFLLIFSFDEFWQELLEARWDNVDLALILAVICSVVAVGLAFFGNREFHSTLVFACLYVLMMYFVIQVETDLYAIYFQLATNIVLVALGIWLIIRGIQENVTHYFFLGVTSILITGLLRYIDLVGDYIGAAILFIIFAVILLSAARFWKSHRKALESSNAE